LKRRRQLDAGLRDGVRGKAPELREDSVGHVTVRADRRHRGSPEAGTKRARSGRRRRELGQMSAHVAIVGNGLARARTAGKIEAGCRPGTQGDVNAVKVLQPLSISTGAGDEVAHLSCLRRYDVVEAGDDVSPAARQTGIL